VQRVRLPLPAVLLIFVFGLAACGGGGESDEDKITSTIETAATSTDPAACGETQTLKFMEQTAGGGSGGEAEKQCEKEAEEGTNQPDSVTVSQVKVSGESATANAEFKGGTFNDQTLELSLVEEGGEWKLDEFTGFAKFDPAPFVKTLTEQIESEPELEPEAAACVIEGIEELSNSQLESAIVENKTEVFAEIGESCE
jgi:ABC-type glycerol-3-phosphate transport system substrate-binding protein